MNNTFFTTTVEVSVTVEHQFEDPCTAIRVLVLGQLQRLACIGECHVLYAESDYTNGEGKLPQPIQVDITELP